MATTGKPAPRSQTIHATLLSGCSSRMCRTQPASRSSARTEDTPGSCCATGGLAHATSPSWAGADAAPTCTSRSANSEVPQPMSTAHIREAWSRPSEAGASK
eukprot:scaffold789_cov125-Isochrysis_galbana.AAC.6